MRIYEVQPGDTPASIAAQDAHAGCPKCSIDLIAANPHKPTRTHPNGYVTFRELRAGEKLNIPDKWASKEFDALPPSYFAALPFPDGVTPGKRTTGVGETFSPELVAAAKQADAAIAASAGYCDDVARVGTPVNSAVHAFKLAWNATQPDKVPINTGNYESATAEALRRVLGEAFEPCAARRVSVPRAPTPSPVIVTPPSPSKVSTGNMVGYGLLAAGAVGGGIYLFSRRGRKWR